MVGKINKSIRTPASRSESVSSLPRRGLILLLAFILPLVLGAWRDVSGNTINPRYVARIKNGVTTRHEIMLWFGDPKDVDRTPEGAIYKYESYKDAPALPSTKLYKEVDEQSSSLLFIDEDKKIKKKKVKTEGKILKSTLTIRFKPDGETVMSHEYKEY
ncbi:MAG: hypothetical protein AB1491_13935 [Thermodesulfobacteriota bacterium]